MKKHAILCVLLLGAFVLLGVQIFAAQKQETGPTTEKKRQKTPKEINKSTLPNNFEAIVKDNVGAEITAWTGQIFSIANAKAIGTISSENQSTHLPLGNYVLMLRFKKDIPELKGHRPFTFIITQDKKTIFTLTVGKSAQATIDYDVMRYGSDYDNFELLIPGPEHCQTKCMKDPKCKAWGYAKPGRAGKNAHCWLKHSVPPPLPSPGGISGVVPRDSVPYQIERRFEKLE